MQKFKPFREIFFFTQIVAQHGFALTPSIILKGIYDTPLVPVVVEVPVAITNITYLNITTIFMPTVKRKCSNKMVWYKKIYILE